MRKFGASVLFRDFCEGSFEIDNVWIQTMLLNYPGNCLGYRVRYQDKCFAMLPIKYFEVMFSIALDDTYVSACAFARR